MTKQNLAETGIGFPSQFDIIGIAAAVLPFICKISSSSTKTVNGKVVEHTHIDYFAIAGGVVAIGIAVALLMMVFTKTPENDRLKRIGVIVLIVAVGAYQLLVRGTGII